MLVFEKEVIFHEFDFETSDLEFEVSKSSIWESTQLRVTRVLFLILSRNFDHRLSSNFHWFVMLCICWDTPTVKASLWQLPVVSRVFKGTVQSFYRTSGELPQISHQQQINKSTQKIVSSILVFYFISGYLTKYDLKENPHNKNITIVLSREVKVNSYLFWWRYHHRQVLTSNAVLLYGRFMCVDMLYRTRWLFFLNKTAAKQ